MYPDATDGVDGVGVAAADNKGKAVEAAAEEAALDLGEPRA